MSLDNELQLVEAAQKNTEAFTHLYEYYFPKVYAFVAAKINDRDTTEDLVSESFMKILTHLPQWQWQGAPFGAWVFRIVKNVLYDYFRSLPKKTIDIENIAPVKDQSPEASPETVTKNKELAEKVHMVLKNLSSKEADIVHLKFFCCLSNKEIARTVGLTENNVGVIIYRTLLKIKPELQNIL